MDQGEGNTGFSLQGSGSGLRAIQGFAAADQGSDQGSDTVKHSAAPHAASLL